MLAGLGHGVGGGGGGGQTFRFWPKGYTCCCEGRYGI